MRRVKKGMTLLEVVIALGIMAIMIGPLMSSLLTAVQANKKGEDVQDAKLLGQQLVEKFRLEDNILEGGKVEFYGDEIKVMTGTVGPNGKNTMPIESNGIFNGFSLKGKIIEEDSVSNINDIYDLDGAIKKDIGLFIYLDLTSDGKVKGYIRQTSNLDNKISNVLDLTNIENKPIGDSKEKIKIEVKVNSENKIEVFIDENKFSSISGDIPINGEIVIYIKDAKTILESGANKHSINIGIENNVSTDFIQVQILKDYNLEKKAFDESVKVETKGKINRFENIIYDTENKKKGLYTIELDISKENNIIESTKSQFYLGE